MPVRQHGQAPVAGPSSSTRWNDEDVKPKIKPEPYVIDLCDSDPESLPPKPVASSNESDGKRRPKRERSTGPRADEVDDFVGSSTKRRSKERATSSTPASSATPKLYAIARIVTLATDGVASSSESEAKLANVSSGILSRIQKSLALAKHPGTGEAEAQQALRLATRLMSSQNLTQADLLATSSDESNQSRAGMSIVEIVSQTNASSPRNESWVNQVAIAVNLFFDVKAYSTSYANRTKLSWTFYGLAINTVAAAHAFEMVHNQVLTWAYEKATKKLVSGKTGKNSYCQGVAAGLISLAKMEKKQELRLAIETEKKRLKDAEEKEQNQLKKEKDRLRDPSPSAPIEREAAVKPEPRDNLASGARNVKLEDVEDEEDVKPFRNGIKRSISRELDQGYGRWTEGGLGSNDLGYHESDHEDDHDRFYDMNDSPYTPSGLGDDPMEDVKPHFDETLERDIIDLTDELDPNPSSSSATTDTKPKLETEDIKPKIEPDEPEAGAGWQSGNQLIRFRQDAEKIADDYLASQHSGLKLKKRAKSTFIKDSSAFEQGREDAKKIDVKRKRIQN